MKERRFNPQHWRLAAGRDTAAERNVLCLGTPLADAVLGAARSHPHSLQRRRTPRQHVMSRELANAVLGVQRVVFVHLDFKPRRLFPKGQVAAFPNCDKKPTEPTPRLFLGSLIGTFV
jgi:hypothetical protein